jgi:2-iminobutanoate/2-iminopropanoate deaminase
VLPDQKDTWIEEGQQEAKRLGVTSPKFVGANLKNADLTDAKTYGMNFEDADLSGAIMPDGERYNQEATQKNSQILIPATRKVIFTNKAPFPVGANSQAIAASGQFIFVTGQTAIDLRINGKAYQHCSIGSSQSF